MLAGTDELERLWIEGESTGWDVTDPFSSSEGIGVRFDGHVVRGRLELQSERTAPLVDGLFETGMCGLADLMTSIHQHRVLLDGLFECRPDSIGGDSDRVPIS